MSMTNGDVVNNGTSRGAARLRRQEFLLAFSMRSPSESNNDIGLTDLQTVWKYYGISDAG